MGLDELDLFNQITAEYAEAGLTEARARRFIRIAIGLLAERVDLDALTIGKRELANSVVIDMVIVALSLGERRGHASYSWANGKLSGSGTLVAGADGVQLLDWHLALFGISLAPTPKWSFPKAVPWP